MEGSEDGDGKGAKGYGVAGMRDGPGSVSTLSTEECGGEPDEDKVAGLDVDDASEWVDRKGEGNGKEDEDKVESEGAAEARAAARRMRTTEDHMGVQRGTTWTVWGR
jgi:hypothetical protein